MLTAEQLDSYAKNGFLLVPGVISASEAADLRTEGHAIIARQARSFDVEATWDPASEVDRDHGPTELQHCHDAQFESAAFSRLLTDDRLIGPVAQLMGTPNVQLHHNKLFVKPPEKGSPFPMHQDYPFFPHRDDSLIAAIVHLDDAPKEKGCVRAVPGSHRLGRLSHDGDTQWYLPTTEFPVDNAQPLPAKAGDVLYFSCLTIHGSGVNVSAEARTTWLVQMRDAADVPTVDRHRSPGQGTMLAGTNTGLPRPPSPF